MAYKRPLTKVQSIIIALLWLVFVVLFLFTGEKTPFSCFVLLWSAFIVFYPIWKSYKERQEKENK